MKAKGIFWREDRKCPPSAKVGLAPEEKRAETFVFDAEPGVETRVSATLSYVYSPLEMTESRRSATFLTLGTVVR